MKVTKECMGCGSCTDVCLVDAISITVYAEIDQDRCVHCGECLNCCPVEAIKE